ncbi:MAG: SpoIIE family protein phosphatase [Lachnospiraceae bacterium]|nr:SpoIIE family protein phosphatase [Lachnospiraceae bacterium]
MKEQKGWLVKTAAIVLGGIRLGAALGAAAGIFCAVIYVVKEREMVLLTMLLVAGLLMAVARYSWRSGKLRVERLKPSGRLPEEEAIAVEKLESIGEALHLLADHYQELPENAWEPGESYIQAVTWYAGYLEEKQAASVGMEETARLIGALLCEYQEMEDATGQWKARLGERMKEKKLALDRLRIKQSGNGRMSIDMTVHTMRSRCIPTKELTVILNQELGKTVKPDQGARAVIGKDPIQICFREETEFHMLYEVAREVKEESSASGDNFSCMKLSEGKAVFGLSDGMGTGELAAKDSEAVMELAEKLLEAGYGENAVARLINAILIQKGNRRPVTLDLATVDLYTGECCFTKLGAVTTCLRRNGTVELISGEALPAGVLTEAYPMTETKQLEHGDMIVMVTDGVLDAFESGNREELLQYLVAGTTSENPKEVARQILGFACEMGGSRLDDMTVLAAGIWKK